MSLFGTSPPDEAPSMQSSFARSRQSLFDEEDSMTQSQPQAQSQSQSQSNSIFQDDGDAGSPWDMPTPRKQQSRADLLRNLLPASDAPESYIETFDNVVRDDGVGGKVSFEGIMRVLAAAKLDADAQAKIMSIIAPRGGEVALGRNEFNVLLGLVGLAQEGETVSLDGVDERRKSESFLFLPFFFFSFHFRFSTTQLCTHPTRHYLLHMQPPVPHPLRNLRALYLLSLSANGTLWRLSRLGGWCCVGNWPSHLLSPLRPRELLWGG